MQLSCVVFSFVQLCNCLISSYNLAAIEHKSSPRHDIFREWWTEILYLLLGETYRIFWSSLADVRFVALHDTGVHLRGAVLRRLDQQLGTDLWWLPHAVRLLGSSPGLVCCSHDPLESNQDLLLWVKSSSNILKLFAEGLHAGCSKTAPLFVAGMDVLKSSLDSSTDCF